MTLREDEIVARVNGWLERRVMPAHLAAKPKAAQAEAAAVCRAILGYVPTEGWSVFLQAAFDGLDRRMPDRAWPTVREVTEACEEAHRRGVQPVTYRDGLDMSAAAIFGRRMLAGEPVPESWLKPPLCNDLIAHGGVSPERIAEYRRGAEAARQIRRRAEQ